MDHVWWSDFFKVCAIGGSVIGLFGTVGNYICGKYVEAAKKSSAEKKDAQIATLLTIQDYGEEAKLSVPGLLYPIPGARIALPADATELAKMLAPTYTRTDAGGYNFKTDGTSLEIYKAVTMKYPKFPFGHYLVSFTLEGKKGDEWKTHAKKAYDILKITTTIPGHQPDHDYVLGELTKRLSEFQ